MRVIGYTINTKKIINKVSIIIPGSVVVEISENFTFNILRNPLDEGSIVAINSRILQSIRFSVFMLLTNFWYRGLTYNKNPGILHICSSNRDFQTPLQLRK